MPVPLELVDEVYLGLTVAQTYLKGEGHRPMQDFTGHTCRACDTFYYVDNAIKKYLERLRATVAANPGTAVIFPETVLPVEGNDPQPLT